MNEKELDRILGKALRTDDEFLFWFLDRSGLVDAAWRRVLIRDDWPWGKPRGDQTKFRETDILVVCETGARDRVAVHIENKGPRRRFDVDQASDYPRRARAWAGVEKWGSYKAWRCVLIAPTTYLERSLIERSYFDQHVSYEELAIHLPPFGETEQ